MHTESLAKHEIWVSTPQIWLMLFSDMLLLTRQQGKILTSIEPPIFLDRLLVQDINCTEGELVTASKHVVSLVSSLLMAGYVRACGSEIPND